MKKIIIAITALLLTFTTLNAGMGMGAGMGMNQKHALKHANPMPNLMRIVVGNAKLLELTADQLAQVKAWMKTSKPKMKAMIMKVISQEKNLLENALTTDKDVVKQSAAMLNTRKKIITMKTKCRATLKSILNAKQYANTIKIYRSVK